MSKLTDKIPSDFYKGVPKNAKTVGDLILLLKELPKELSLVREKDVETVSLSVANIRGAVPFLVMSVEDDEDFEDDEDDEDFDDDDDDDDDDDKEEDEEEEEEEEEEPTK